MTERSRPVSPSICPQVVAGFAVAGPGFQSRNWTLPPPCARRGAARNKSVIRDRIGVLRWVHFIPTNVQPRERVFAPFPEHILLPIGAVIHHTSSRLC